MEYIFHGESGFPLKYSSTCVNDNCLCVYGHKHVNSVYIYTDKFLTQYIPCRHYVHVVHTHTQYCFFFNLLQLCSYCRFQPEAYLQFKRLLVLEHSKIGKLNLADARKLLKIDVNKTRKVYDLLVSKGLIAPSANN